MSFVSSCSGVAIAATLAEVWPSAPKSTKLISPRTDRRTTFTGPKNSRPLTNTFWPPLMNSYSSTPAPIEACQGKPLRDEATISRAAAVSRETMPAASKRPVSILIASVCPTPLCMSWLKRIGRFWEGMASPAKSTITGFRQPATRIGPPV